MIHSDKDRKEVVKDILATVRDEGFCVLGVDESPIRGPKGNVEFLIYLVFDPTKGD